MTPYITPGTNITLDYVLQNYTNALNTGYNGSSHTEPFYRIHSYMVEHSDSAANFTDFKNGSAVSITSPLPASSLSANESVTAVFTNTGTLDILNPVVSYFLNGNLMQTDTVLMNLAVGATLNHTFSQTADMSVYADYRIDALLTVQGDVNATDDIATLHIDQVTAVRELETHIGLHIVPNPSNGNFNIQISGVSGPGEISIIDLTGKIVYKEQAIIHTDLFEKTIHLRDDQKGVYFLSVTSAKGRRVVKIVLQ